MPLSVSANHREYLAQADRLRAIAAHVPAFANDYQIMLAEMIALQAFYFFELAIEAVAAKIVCGAKYADGLAPAILHKSASVDTALTDMRTIGRATAKGILKWNEVSEITGNVRHLLDSADHFCTACRAHSARLNEIRIVRNHIAHGNAGTRRDFANVVRRRLGAQPRRLPRVGAFILREVTPGTTILTEYVVTLGVVIKDAAKL